MKKTIYLFILLLSGISLYAQEEKTDSTNWKFGGIGSLTFSQVSLHQWAAGGENTLSGAFMLNVFANYSNGNTSWVNTLDLGYGLIRQGDVTKKSDDRIEFTSQFGKKASEEWFYSAMLNFKTQFAEGFDYPDPQYISRFFAPAYLMGSIGMDYKPNDNFQLFLSPVTGKLTFVNDDSLSNAGAYGVEAGNKFRAELGGYAKIAYTNNLMENVTMKTKLDFFANYMKLEELKDVDVNWELLIAMKINKFLSANIFTQMIWDNDVKQVVVEGSDNESGIQLKEVFGLGLSYSF